MSYFCLSYIFLNTIHDACSFFQCDSKWLELWDGLYLRNYDIVPQYIGNTIQFNHFLTACCTISFKADSLSLQKVHSTGKQSQEKSIIKLRFCVYLLLLQVHYASIISDNRTTCHKKQDLDYNLLGPKNTFFFQKVCIETVNHRKVPLCFVMKI